ncbi:MAG: DNA methyltransferase, partial [Acutalibacteraceae bacterium]|nr:DNA methyltransferase [Acutalibacteraceae bacterium]
KIENKKIEEIIPYEKNPRKNDNAVDAVAQSIKEFGFKVPIVIDKNNVIVAGHTRYKASKKLGLEEVPCIVADDLNEEQIKAFRLADNKVAEKAEWDFELLDEELNGIFNIDMSDFGFELDLEDEEEKEIIEDEVPEIPEEPKAKLGDIYQLGNHRLMCGDSTKEEDVAKLMNGVKADMVFTDPPYGMNLDTDFSDMIPSLEFQKDKGQGKGKKYSKVIGDNEDFKNELVTTIFDNFDYCREIFVWGADYYPELLKGYKKGNFIIWDKKSNEEVEQSNFDKTYSSGFEVCWSKNKHKKEIVRCLWVSCFGTEQEFDHQRVHPTQKPTKLSRWFIDKYSKENDLIVDIYGGSGSTLIACEQLNRKCYMMELDEHYVDVIIQRWENFTGEKAIKLN